MQSHMRLVPLKAQKNHLAYEQQLLIPKRQQYLQEMVQPKAPIAVNIAKEKQEIDTILAAEDKYKEWIRKKDRERQVLAKHTKVILEKKPKSSSEGYKTWLKQKQVASKRHKRQEKKLQKQWEKDKTQLGIQKRKFIICTCRCNSSVVTKSLQRSNIGLLKKPKTILPSIHHAPCHAKSVYMQHLH